jgi:hypothetical protein
MPTGRNFARPLLIRRVAEPSRDQQVLLAQTYDRLIGTPAATDTSLVDPPGSFDALSRNPAGLGKPTRPPSAVAGSRVA